MQDQLDFEDYQHQSGSERTQQFGIEEYKEALEHMKKQYQQVQQKYQQKQQEIELLKHHFLKSAQGGEADNFERINQIFELKSEINTLRFESLQQKNAYQKERAQYKDRLTELEQEVLIRQNNLRELANQISAHNKEDLVKKLEEKAMQFMEEIQILEQKIMELQDENKALRQQLQLQEAKFQTGKPKASMISQKSKVSSKSSQFRQRLFEEQSQVQRYKKYLDIQKQNVIRLESQLNLMKNLYEQKILKLTTQVKQQEVVQQNNSLVYKDKLNFGSQETERLKKINETYKLVAVEKEAEINRLNQKILNLQIQKTKTSSGQSETVQNFISKIKQLSQENRILGSKIKKDQITHQEETLKLTDTIKRSQIQIQQKTAKVNELKQLIQSKSEQYRLQTSKLTSQNDGLQQELRKRSATINDLNLQISKNSKQKQSIISEFEGVISNLNIQIDEKQNRIKQLQNTVKQSTKQLTKLTKKQLSHQDDFKNKFILVSQQLKQKSLLQNELRSQLQGSKSDISMLNNEIKQEKQFKRKQQLQITQLQKNIKQLTNQLNSVKKMTDINNNQRQEKSEQLAVVISQLKQDINKQRQKTKLKQQELFAAKIQINKVDGQKSVILLKFQESESNNKSLQNKIESEKEFHKKSLERINSQLQIIKKQLGQSKKSEAKARQELFEQNLKNSEYLSQIENLKHKMNQLQLINKKLQQSDQVLKRKVDDYVIKLTTLQSKVEEQKNNTNQKETKNMLEKERLNIKIKKLEQNISKHKQMQLEYQEMKIILAQNQIKLTMDNDVNQRPLKKRYSGSDGDREKGLSSGMEVNRLRRNNEALSREKQELSHELDQLEAQLQAIRKDNTAMKRQLNSAKKSAASNQEKLDQLEHTNKQLQNSYDHILKEKMNLNQQKNNQIKKLQAELEQAQNANTGSRIDRLQLKSNPISQTEIFQLKSKIKSLENRSQELEKQKTQLLSKVGQLSEQRSLLENKIQILKMSGPNQPKKKKSQSDGKKLDELQDLKLKQQHLRTSYNTLVQQHQHLKQKNIKQVEELQQQIKQMNEVLIAQKKEYELKNAHKFQQQTSAFNQLNRVSQQLQEETQKFKEEKQQLENQKNALNRKIATLEQTINSLKITNQKLIQDNQIDQDTGQLHKRLDTLSNQMDELRYAGKKYPADDRPTSRRDFSYLTQLEQRCREIQETNIKLMNFDTVKSQSMVIIPDRKDNYLQLLSDYNELIHANRQLQSERSRYSSMKEVQKPQSHYFIASSSGVDDELRNVYKQVEVLNNIIMDKDSEIQSLREAGSNRLIPTSDLLPRIPTPKGNLPPMVKRYSNEASLSNSGSQHKIRPSSNSSHRH